MFPYWNNTLLWLFITEQLFTIYTNSVLQHVQRIIGILCYLFHSCLETFNTMDITGFFA